MKLSRLIESLDHYNVYPKLHDFQVRGISCNSTAVGEDFIFVAIEGNKEDGHRFIAEAINNGAKAIVVEREVDISSLPQELSLIKVKATRLALADLASVFYGEPSSKIKTVGITGTNGKTTISYLLEAITQKAGFSPSVIGTINCRFGNQIIPSKNTTPGPLEIQSLLSDMVSRNIDYCFMEVSSHALDQERVRGIKFSAAIFTNLTQDHLDYHKSLEDYFKAKLRLFQDMDQSAFVIINNDDAYASRIKSQTKAKVLTYGIKNKSDFMAGDIKMYATGTEFNLITPGLEFKVFTKLIGQHNVYNILSVVAWATKEGINPDLIKSCLEDFFNVPGRLERIDGEQDFSVFVDYAHTQDALKNVISSLKEISKNRILVVFGCGGDRDKTKRPKMGQVVTELADYAIVTNDNPRSEKPEDIVNDIKRGIDRKNYIVILDRAQAIRQALGMARKGDIVLIAGKGHENYQILNNGTIHFDDREVVKKCLASMK